MHKSILSFLFIITGCVASAFAQGGTGQLSGNVVDANGAVVAGASIKLTSLVTSQDREATTNDASGSGRICWSFRHVTGAVGYGGQTCPLCPIVG